MENIIVGTWGIGPSYRRRVRLNIQKAINTGYDNILPYIILTDAPEEFYELQDKTKKIIDIVDIHEVREKYSPWSKNYEIIPKEKYDEVKYGKEFRENYDNGKYLFSYALYRFYLPRISELGYNKFIHCDCDYNIRYDKIVNGSINEKDFWEHLNTPVYTMRGETFVEYHHNNAINDWSNITITMANILRYEMGRRHPEYKKKLNYVAETFPFTEGCFRYYHFKKSSEILQYFLFWDEIAEICLTDDIFRVCSGGSSRMYIDYVMWIVANDMFGIKCMDFSKQFQTSHMYWSDRYFYPLEIGTNKPDGTLVRLNPAETREKFLEINKEAIEYLKSNDLGYFNEHSPD